MNQRLSPGASTSGEPEVRGPYSQRRMGLQGVGSATSPAGAPPTTQSPSAASRVQQVELVGQLGRGGPVLDWAGHRPHSEEFGRRCKQGVTAD